ncbi:hypothetical protein [Gordonia sp. (in: high G+C Gram-positive bacteria)]|uniref:hypothetical protein n=1 Tax=Gordonia sp. (in: high G+C Gram-positive bacteria) TaxID=84139 RepID=UPI0039E36E41
MTILVTALIPLLLWRLGAKQAKRDGELNELQAATLARQEQTFRRQRRDSLLEIVDRSSDSTHLGLLWREVNEFEGGDRELLLGVFRANVSLALPGTSTGLEVHDELTDTAVAQYVSGLERRYGEGTPKFRPYPGLLDFVSAASRRGVNIEPSEIVALVTGPTSEYQKPNHGFYRDLVNTFPQTAGGLIHAVERIDYRTAGGLRLNVLTGALLATKDVELGRREQRSVLTREAAVSELRLSVPSALALLLHRDNLRSFDRWSLEGSTEPVSATVAWLIRVVGWIADTDDHLAMRMIENLSGAIGSVPLADRQWGIDAADVRQGFAWIRQKQPVLWEMHGAALEAAATRVGAWRDGADDHR